MIKRLATGNARLELGGHAGEVLVGEVLGLVVGLDAIDFLDDRPQFLELAIVLGSNEKFQQIHTWDIIS